MSDNLVYEGGIRPESHCICPPWSFDGAPELQPDCPIHGDPAVLTQIYSDEELPGMWSNSDFTGGPDDAE